MSFIPRQAQLSLKGEAVAARRLSVDLPLPLPRDAFLDDLAVAFDEAVAPAQRIEDAANEALTFFPRLFRHGHHRGRWRRRRIRRCRRRRRRIQSSKRL